MNRKRTLFRQGLSALLSLLLVVSFNSVATSFAADGSPSLDGMQASEEAQPLSPDNAQSDDASLDGAQNQDIDSQRMELPSGNADVTSRPASAEQLSPTAESTETEDASDEATAQGIVANAAGLLRTQLLREQVRAEDLGEPAHQKILSKRSDGTYDLTLTVQGDSISSQDIMKANVLVVLDASYSMRNSAGSGGSRMNVAKNCIRTLANTLLSQNSNQSETLIEMSLVTFGTRVESTSSWYTDASSFGSMVNGVSYYTNLAGGTNWEAALETAKSVADAKTAENSNPTYVIFVSDGFPTFRNTQGSGWNDMNQGAHNSYGVWGTGNSNDNTSISRCYEMSKDDARSIVLAGHEFYGISVFEQVSRVTSLVNYAYTGNDYGSDPTGTQHSYYAADQAALNQALSEIVHNIITHVYYANVTVHDAIDLQNVSFASEGPVAYTLKKELADGTVITYDSATGTTTGGTWNFGTPEFKADGTVSWNPEAGTDALLDDAKYSITFQIAPSQQACDTSVDDPSAFVEGDNDGDGETDALGLPSNVSSEAYVSYHTATITDDGGNVTIDEEGPYTTEYNKPVVTPDPVHVSITKHWNGDSQVAATLRPATLHGTVTRDDGVSYPVELVSTGENTYSVSIDVPAGPTGHQYNLVEEQLPDYYAPSEVIAQASSPSYASWGTLYLRGCGEQNASFSITNSFVAYPLDVQKVQANSNTPLAGAQFTLYLDDDDGVFDAASDQPAAVYADAALTQPIDGSVLETDQAGLATFYGLLLNRSYWLVETRAPTGYNLDSMPHAIIVGLGGTMGTYDSAGAYAELPKYNGVSTIVIADEPIPDLPLTAGTGIRLLVMAGGAFLLVGLVLAGASANRKRKARAKPGAA